MPFPFQVTMNRWRSALSLSVHKGHSDCQKVSASSFECKSVLCSLKYFVDNIFPCCFRQQSKEHLHQVASDKERQQSVPLHTVGWLSGHMALVQGSCGLAAAAQLWRHSVSHKLQLIDVKWSVGSKIESTEGKKSSWYSCKLVSYCFNVDKKDTASRFKRKLHPHDWRHGDMIKSVPKCVSSIDISHLNMDLNVG